nr:immunoglobulin light chain junction region [Macaca mulatta]MOW51896.1 immunoglobulin light chain junction region [Macaca mulatta]MOW52611.1 immunoglobulin light chain junction region [Macaca mulatta]MOW52848.1 immunoglobulin light chain junction region [Macaca mulatta]MOW52890.1 immunoglobulin light chain junction region [Macaca mulatta]
CLQGYNTPYTF